MQPAELRRLLPDAPAPLCRMLAASAGPVQPPIRSEIFGAQRFAEHGRSLGETHRAARAGLAAASFFPRLHQNIAMLREAQAYIGAQAATGYDLSPAAEWLLDNFHLIEAQLREIHAGLPRRYFRALPVLLDPPLAGLPRIYGVAWAFVAHTDGAFDEDLLLQFLNAYQQTRELNLGEIWALPTTLRVLLIENLRRLAERVALHKAARELANLCSDRIDHIELQALQELLALMDARGVGPVFLAQMLMRLQGERTAGQTRAHEWLRQTLQAQPELAALQAQQSADHTADNLSVSNAVNALRAIGDADWPELIAQSSSLMQLMLSAPVFEAEQQLTRDQTLHEIERLARRSGRSELAVAQILLELMRIAPGGAASSAAHWLAGPGRPALTRALGLRSQTARPWRRLALPVYLSALLLGMLALVAGLLHAWPAAGLATGLVAALMLVPASEALVALINRLVSESLRPARLPRLALRAGIPPERRVMVVIPAMLTDTASTAALVQRLHWHYLANPESQAQFALLSDSADADTEHHTDDDDLLADARRRIDALNEQHPADPAGPAPRFLLLHRPRRFSASEQRWIGWERKRGKLEQLIAALSAGAKAESPFIDLGPLSQLAAGTRYVLTLDSDTELPPGRLRELVGVAAHPHNEPRLDASGRRVLAGYAILQPRVVTPLPAPRELTLYHRLFAGRCGIDPYSAASSEVYQDLFGEGTFTGKGLLHVQAMQTLLAGRLPEGQVLSHDLLEGSLARCAAVTDIPVIEEAPFHADVAAARVHRWMRGDWQLLPFLLQCRRYPLRGINRWKMFDNLRRSLVAPASVALLLLALLGWEPLPLFAGSALLLVLAAYLSGPLIGALAGFSPSSDRLAKRHFYRQALIELARALAGGLWHLALLLQEALRAVDAIVRALYRLSVSQRLLLQWTTAAAAQAAARTRLAEVVRQHWGAPLLAAGLLGGLWGAGTPYPWLSLGLCLLWAGTPLWIWAASRPPRGTGRQDPPLPAADRLYLHGIARDTWRFFERCVGPEDRHLPPDNLQSQPQEMLAHRTSPTNIGLYLLSAACARRFGWIGTQELLDRLEATLASLHGLQRHRGHFLNWYDTQTGAALLPLYVSSVDSGNLSGHLLAVAQSCRGLLEAPHAQGPARQALAVSKQRLQPLLAAQPELLLASSGLALARLLSLEDEGDEFGEALDRTALLQAAQEELARLPAEQTLGLLLADHLATLRSAWADREAGTQVEATRQRLRAVARDCEQLAWAADFSFLYHRRRRLFHIGYRVAEQQLDAGFYDLLASESRLGSLLAIAKGDVPVSHWAALGRPFFAVGAAAGLRSWSGSMFEYLMPGLVLAEPQGSALREACGAALREQIAFADEHRVPWGISESAYAGRDHTLAYQYSPQGVPRLALRRTPPDELVIAPYATALAVPLDAARAVRNFRALEALSARGRYGFIEALDFTAARRLEGQRFTPVCTQMAHHQGMSIVALANALLDGAAQTWGMGNEAMAAVGSLLHERAPREVAVLRAPPAPLPQKTDQRRASGLLREVLPGVAAVEPTHLLSNGRYSVSLRANGAGASQWGRLGMTRWRDDALRDAYGSFFYLRRQPAARLVSLTQHPAPDAAAEYQSVFHADRVTLGARWPELQTQISVWVSPEDDIEFRRIELHNLGDQWQEIELVSAFEPSLSESRADEAHPAFTNLFVRAEWRASAQALLFERRPRLAHEPGLQAAHFLTDCEAQILSLRAQTDRQRWLGRNNAASRPLGELAELDEWAEGSPLDTGLDPVCALAVRLRIAPRGKALLTFATAASDNGATLLAVIDKYRQASHVQRASLMSATLAGVRLRSLRISPENFAAIQPLTTALLLSLSRADAGRPEGSAPARCDRRLLWRHGISGDKPLLLVSTQTPQGLGLLRALIQALRLWAWGGVACDLVVLNAEPASYQMSLQREVAALAEQFRSDSGLPGGAAGPGSAQVHLLRSDELSPEELGTLQTLARVHLRADGRPLLHHLLAWNQAHEQARTERQQISTVALAAAPAGASVATQGRFAPDSGEFQLEVGPGLRPLRPWINVLANPDFGAQLSEAGGGYSWALNSRMNQLTAWSNDPVADPPSESFLLQDCKTLETWSVTPSAWGAQGRRYRVAHGQGYSEISHRCGELEVLASWCVDPQTAVKQVRLQLLNRGARSLQLRVIGLAEWMMGATRADRGTVLTAHHTQRLPDARLHALLCTQCEAAAGFGQGTAFLALAQSGSATDPDWTCDRRELFDARGHPVLPDHLGRVSGRGLDPCAALSADLSLAAGETAESVFLLGYAASPDAARQLAAEAALVPAEVRLQQQRDAWDQLLGAATVSTPDPLFDQMVNRWLLYQVVSCRLWAKAGFYQAGGATGFRDQLQDAMALAWARPALLRAQILRCAGRQFAEGDVQHWWHEPTGAGVRTHFSDDLLWLPHACVHYLRATGDTQLLDERVGFIEGPAIPEGAEDAYYAPTLSSQTASLFEHAALAIDRSLRVGAHGLPLMGTGDWNDGMNRVGAGGRGESVWLAWFLCRLVADFAPIAHQRGELARERRWREAAAVWQAALAGPAWDGQWFKRAFFDEGQALGSQHNSEARIDLIAQAWAVLSGAAPPDLAAQAMAAVETQLVDHEAGLIRLLTPPLAHAQPSAGYIQAYPPGVRENGGQYSHAGVWALMAQALLGGPAAGEQAYRYFCHLSPAHRAAHEQQGRVYGIEPYVMAGDVYSQPPYVGRGGWSWYTGAAAWLQRAALESLFGLRLQAQHLSFQPCLPPHWPQAELSLRRDERVMRFVFLRGDLQAAQAAAAAITAAGPVPAQLLRVGQVLDWQDLTPSTCFVLPLL